MTTKFLKGLLITLVTTFIAAYTQVPLIWAVVYISLIGNALTYTGKNAWFKSTSVQGQLNLRDFGSAGLIAIGSAITEAIATLTVSGVVNWPLLGKVVLSAVVSYLSATLFEGDKQVSTNSSLKPKLTFIFLLLGFGTLLSNAQGPWKGFFKPASERISINYKLTYKTVESAPTTTWIYTPNFGVVATIIQLTGDNKVFTTNALNAIATGISLKKYDLSGDNPICTQSYNFMILSRYNSPTISTDQVKVPVQQALKWGPAFTVSAFANSPLIPNAGIYWEVGQKRPALLLNVIFHFNQ